MLREYYIQGEAIPRVPSHKDLGVIVDTSLKFHLHVRSVVNKSAGLSANILKSTLCRSKDFMLSLYVSHIRPLIEFGSCLWNTGYLGDLKLLESVQRRWTRQIEGMSDLSYHDRLKALDLYSVQGRLLRADLIKYWKIFHGECGILPEDVFTKPPPVATRGHRYKIAHVFSSTKARKRFFSVRCVAQWNSLPDSIVALNSVGAFKAALHNFLGPSLYQYVDT